MSTLIQITKPTELIVNNTPIIGGVDGRVLFQGTGNVLQQSANFFWENTTGRLELTTSADNQVGLLLKSTTGILKVRTYLSGTYGTLIEARNLADSAYTPMSLSGSKLMLLDGNVLINTPSDAGYKLDVNGTTRVKGVGTTSSTTAFTVQNSSGTTNFLIRDDGQLASSGTDSNIYSNFTTGNKSPLLFSHSGYGTATPNDTRIDIGFRGRQSGGLNSYDFLTYKVFQGTDPNVTTGFEFYTHQNQSGASASVLAMSINGGNVGIGTTSPAQKLDVNGTSILRGGLTVNVSTPSITTINAASGNKAWSWIMSNNDLQIREDGIGFPMVFKPAGNIITNQNGGNFLINTTTDAGFRLDVNGTARVSGSELRVGNLQLLTSGSPGATGQGITTTGRKISLQSQGEINIDNAAAYQFLGYADSPVAMTQNATGRTVSFVQVKGGFSSPNYNNTQGNLLWINPVYNMGGTTNAGQILRGIYYNPTLTDLTNATHYAIHTTSGRIRFEGLPTSSAGLSAGEIWNDGGTIRIV